MGYTSWSSDAYSHLKTAYSGKSADQIFSSGMNPTMDPHGLVFRESRDSDAHPNSIAIAVFLDVTGSMGQIPEMLIRHKLGSLMDTLLAHGVEDPQVMFSAIGDHHTDRVPLQIGQFESGTDELNDCLSKVYLEGGGGAKTWNPTSWPGWWPGVTPASIVSKNGATKVSCSRLVTKKTGIRWLQTA